MYENISIEKFFDEYIETLKIAGYKPATISGRHYHCRKVIAYANKIGVKSCSVAFGNEYLNIFFLRNKN